jgi:hypothetical protein
VGLRAERDPARARPVHAPVPHLTSSRIGPDRVGRDLVRRDPDGVLDEPDHDGDRVRSRAGLGVHDGADAFADLAHGVGRRAGAVHRDLGGEPDGPAPAVDVHQGARVADLELGCDGVRRDLHERLRREDVTDTLGRTGDVGQTAGQLLVVGHGCS